MHELLFTLHTCQVKKIPHAIYPECTTKPFTVTSSNKRLMWSPVITKIFCQFCEKFVEFCNFITTSFNNWWMNESLTSAQIQCLTVFFISKSILCHSFFQNIRCFTVFWNRKQVDLTFLQLTKTARKLVFL